MFYSFIMRKLKPDYNLKDKELIKDFIRVLRHYKEAFKNPFKYRQFNRFQLEKYYAGIQADFRLFLRCYKFNRKYKKILN